MSDCILWTGPKWAGGRYGMDKVNGKCMGAHRAAWVRKYGKIPEGIFVCHKCDNGLCVNTDHLFLGTAKDNMQDCKQKGRLRSADQKGQNNNNAHPELEERYAAIKADKKNGLSLSQICKKHGIKSNGHLVKILRH